MRYSVGIELSEEIKESLAQVKSSLAMEFKEVSWVKDQHLHLTIQFLGNPHGKERRLLTKNLDNAASQCAPFKLCSGKIECFPENGAVKTIWMKMSELSDLRMTMIERFQKECLNVFSIKADSDREFIPHIVIGRVSGKTPKGNIRSAVRLQSCKEIKLNVSEAVLIESRLSKKGPDYNVGHRSPFLANFA